MHQNESDESWYILSALKLRARVEMFPQPICLHFLAIYKEASLQQ
jgi:hypothetical protein